MIYCPSTFTCVKENNESVYNFCREVINYRDCKGFPHHCKIGDVVFRCELDDTVDSLITRYTDYYDYLILQECKKQMKPTTKIRIFNNVTSSIVEEEVNGFIKNKKIIDIKYQPLYLSLDRAVNDRVLVIYEEVE